MKFFLRDRVLALAGVFQAASLVKQIADQGKANNAIIENSIETLFEFESLSAESIFGGIANVSWVGADGVDPLACDTGPGGALLDEWVERETGRSRSWHSAT